MSDNDTQALTEAVKLALQAQVGEVLTTSEMQEKYDVQGFSAYMCVVRRKSDNALGSLDFSHYPRFYHSFVATPEK